MEKSSTQSPGATISLDAAGATDVGLERERNEDQFLIARLQRNMDVLDTSVRIAARQWLPGSSEGTLLLVADGMGGAQAGHVASYVAVRAIADYVCNVMPWAEAASRAQGRPRIGTLPGVRRGLESALAKGDAEVRRAAAVAGVRSPMGTTATMAYIQWPHLYVAHAGDSRCYLVRAGQLLQLTTDHTYAEQLRQHSNINVDASSPWHHVLWNALGGGETGTVEPEIHRRALLPEDIIILCSDGLTKHVSDKEILEIATTTENATTACQQMVKRANSQGGTDNTTVVMARCMDISASDHPEPISNQPGKSSAAKRRRGDGDPDATVPLRPVDSSAAQEALVKRQSKKPPEGS